jgi:hypothetical protein
MENAGMRINVIIGMKKKAEQPEYNILNFPLDLEVPFP